MSKPKIIFFSGKRGGFSHFVPIIREIEKNKKFQYKIVVTDMHLSKTFGNTLDEIKLYSRKIHKIKTNSIEDGSSNRTKLISTIIIKMKEYLNFYKPHFLVVLGDRSEVLGAAIASLHSNVPLVHMYGGDITQGGTDEPTRHAITKLSHIHLTSNKSSSRNVLNLSEEKWRVFNIGFTSLDLFREKNFFYKKNFIFKKYKLDQNLPLLILIQHSVTWQINDSRKQIIATLKALKALKVQILAIYPCSDPGYLNIIKELKKTNKMYSNFHLYKNINLRDFYNLFKYSSIILGNSSCGITESAFFQVPAINIGTRQEGRFSGKNVYNIGHSSILIRKTILKLLNKKLNYLSSKYIYGNGKSAIKIINIFEKMLNRKKLIEKKFIN